MATIKLKMIQLTMILIVSLVALPSFSLMQNASVDAIRNDYELTFSKRDKLSNQLSNLEVEYLNIVRKVDRAKKNIRSIAGRLELESLLRNSKAISQKLSTIQRKLLSMNTTLESKRRVIVRHISQEMRTLERSISNASKEDRLGIVNQLNALRRAKIEFTAPLPSIPSSENVKLALRDADSLQDDPDALLAVADELEDTEDQLKRRLSAIDNQLKELKSNQKLMRRARSFSNEDQFFEESDRARVIAKYNSITENGQASKGVRESDDATTINAKANSAGTFENSSVDGDQAAVEVSTPVFSPQEQEHPPERIEIRGNNPSRSIGNNPQQKGSGFKTRIKKLEREKLKLNSRVRRLKRRAKTLRKRANNL